MRPVNTKSGWLRPIRSRPQRCRATPAWSSLTLTVTPELAAEGTARDVVRIVQQARRDAGLAVSDRIRLTIGADGAVADAVRAHADFVAGETLAVDVTVLPAAEVDAAQPVGDGGSVRVQSRRL